MITVMLDLDYEFRNCLVQENLERLSLSHAYGTQKLVYDQSQIQLGKPFSYVEVVVYQDDNSEEHKKYLQALIKMEIACLYGIIKSS